MMPNDFGSRRPACRPDRTMAELAAEIGISLRSMYQRQCRGTRLDKPARARPGEAPYTRHGKGESEAARAKRLERARVWARASRAAGSSRLIRVHPYAGEIRTIEEIAEMCRLTPVQVDARIRSNESLPPPRAEARKKFNIHAYRPGGLS